MPSASVPTYDQAPSSLKAMRTCALADDTNSNYRLAYCAHSTACCFTSACCWLLPPRKRMRIVEPLGHSFAIWNAAREIGRAPIRTPVTNAHLVCRLLLENQKLEH